MKTLVDTNVMMDILTRRDPWFNDLYVALSSILESDGVCMFSVFAVTDVFHMIRKATGSPVDARTAVEGISHMVTIVEVQPSDIQVALTYSMSDFEDAVVAAVARRHGAKRILTRNVKDFAASPVTALTPTDYVRHMHGRENERIDETD